MRALVTVAFGMEVPEGVSPDEARAELRQLARELRDGMVLNALAALERSGRDASDVDELLTLYAPTVTWSVPLAVRDA